MNRSSLADDERMLVGYAIALADGIQAALAPWVVRSVHRVAEDQGLTVDPATADAAAAACRREVGDRIAEVLALDIDDQTVNPLQLLREAVRYPSGVLRSLGARPVDRDPFAVENFPDDPFNLTPASFADMDHDLQDLGLHWGAAKAHVHLQRRRTRS
ncbi:MAG: hypothetical protein OEW42_09290 [Acidimicrobiia bacterium]|nr:hypothetical protein [Acidimicrobiia bacterium]MDH5237175.1 hypothetical protein [Acidimicrobiia bacterium]